jgi:hypothetical protein
MEGFLFMTMILGGIVAVAIWMNVKFNRIEKDFAIMRTVLIMNKLMPTELVLNKLKEEK